MRVIPSRADGEGPRSRTMGYANPLSRTTQIEPPEQRELLCVTKGRLRGPSARFASLGMTPLMEIVGLAADQLFVSEGPDFFGFDQDHVVRVLDLTFDHEKWFFRNQKPHPFE
jgi:hypothetical protein